MIHKIHTGTQLRSDYTIYGYRGSVNINGVTFPGDRRDCEKCHVNGSEQLPLLSNLLPVVTPRDYLTTTPPTTAACLGCHTDKSAAAHANLDTAPVLGESCDVCHGPDADFSVDRVHARWPTRSRGSKSRADAIARRSAPPRSCMIPEP